MLAAGGQFVWSSLTGQLGLSRVFDLELGSTDLGVDRGSSLQNDRETIRKRSNH